MSLPFLDRVEDAVAVLVPLGSALFYQIYKQGQDRIKIDTMWAWFTNHGSEITGYKKDVK